ncbi:hypothetical protein A2715_00585 [Candidatus Woesebacteria bacterium RIFCSPHIGHO2_01_FULL_39_32]|uniref:Thioredoxin domain-containing protein n=1 Tax=Candidatus Woesebacteria bacterium RIFCSPLOWO2_01_FULL_39_25 TaxID=1802521 RepID=A0A1F8BKB6_9BACT|nr:MAG: hypothetical protein A2124_03385 [Candidatus Woesebacteria bacterium GWB1_37_5]OGM24411.1 MAG: hypothetical protein A2715_00585 [Candidatus Woesebacteria bacterium RIFCSPHIGHO2_01_FULL_39_32]OGM38368.1 MAG: hypothetical protein A3F01_06115 [Candidatus Woesebacteria bacterium RIFCSPHIGHO2_12_FULL_38_11]OGM63718.1 MAG: hypothetical protein A2893_01925 [Candidatus Woesebacteria bacterium RIFCSPLOWO2_01_FULL_39_25]
MTDFIKKISEKYFLVFLVGSIALAVVIGLLLRKTSSGQATSGEIAESNDALKQSPVVVLNQEQITKIPKVTEDEHIRGKFDAPVTLIVYSDYECPFCGQYHFILVKLLNEYKENLRLVYRHYPLEDTHPASPILAEASECVNELGGSGAFWKFSDAVFENKEALSDLNYAADFLGVDSEDLNQCFQSRKYKDKVQLVYEEGIKTGIRVTPSTLVMNDKGEVWFIPGAYSYEDLKVVVEEAVGN